MTPERPDQDDDFLEDEEQEEYGQRSIFATGWFRAVLVLLVLAVIAVIAVPLIGGWFEPTPPPKVTSKPSDQPPTVVPVPSTPTTPPAATPPSQMPATSAPPVATPPPTAAAPPATPMPAVPPAATPPAVTTPAPAKPEMPPAASSKVAEKPAEKAKAPERTAAAKGTSKPGASTGSYWVQVGAFKEVRNAEGLAKALRSEGFGVQVAKVTREDTLHVVRVGGYPNRSKAAAAREELQGKGHAGFVTQGPAK